MDKTSRLESKQRIWDCVHSKWDSVNSTANIAEELKMGIAEVVELLEEMKTTNNIREVFQKPTPPAEARCWTTRQPAA